MPAFNRVISWCELARCLQYPLRKHGLQLAAAKETGADGNA
jgi:hypothetical protein